MWYGCNSLTIASLSGFKAGVKILRRNISRYIHPDFPGQTQFQMLLPNCQILCLIRCSDLGSENMVLRIYEFFIPDIGWNFIY